jgi:RNA polymerase sigma factor (sigma-70 family)
MAKRLLSIVHPAPAAVAGNHESVFLARRAHVVRAARRFTAGTPDLAEDLVQDAFIQFVVTRPDLTRIENLDGYLTALIRNLHVSRLRRKSNQHHTNVPIESFDSAELALEAAGIEHRLATRQALERICAYACHRKETSRTASVLILRFFHGFYPGDIARIVRVPARAVHDYLYEARGEARAALTSARGNWPAESAGQFASKEYLSAAEGDGLDALRTVIFTTSRPPCPDARQIRSWYRNADPAPLSVALVGHEVACRRCLEAVGIVLGLPPIDNEGGPTDPAESDSRGSGNQSSATSKARRRRSVQRELRDLFEHRPQELRVSVNGVPVGTLAVESARNRVTWKVHTDEALAFVELHSEQGVRLAILNLAPPIEGELLQRAHVDFSEARFLDVALDFADVHPTITVAYKDPNLVSSPTTVVTAPTPDIDTLTTSIPRAISRWRRALRFLFGRFLVPAASTALVALGSFVWWMLLSRPDVAADRLVEDAVQREQRMTLPAGSSEHRTISLDIRRADSGAVEVTDLIDIWARGASAAKAVRVFDGDGHLVAGRWTDPMQRMTSLDLGLLDDLWTADLSAATFRERYMAASRCRADRGRIDRTITCDRPATTSWLQAIEPRVLADDSVSQPSRAVLVLRGADLHAVRFVLTMRLGDAERTVTLEERATARVATAREPADVFVPDSIRRAAAVGPTVPSGTAASVRARSSDPSLEMRAVEIVDRLAAGDDIAVQQTDGGLRVFGLVASQEKRDAIRQAITALGAGPTVVASVGTFAEAAARAQGSADAAKAETRVELRALPSGPAPIESYLRARMPSDTALRKAVDELTPRALTATTALRQHAYALSTALDRFPEDRVAGLDASARQAWRALIGRHAQGCATALDTLDRTLAPYFNTTGDSLEFVNPSPTLSAAVQSVANEAATVDGAVASALTATDSANHRETAVAADVRDHIQRLMFDINVIQQLVGR